MGGAGGAATGLATGTVVGAALGLIPAVFTFGLSIPLGAAIGGSTGAVAGGVAGGAVGFVGGGVAGRTVHTHSDQIGEGAAAVANKANSLKAIVNQKSSQCLEQLSGKVSEKVSGNKTSNKGAGQKKLDTTTLPPPTALDPRGWKQENSMSVGPSIQGKESHEVEVLDEDNYYSLSTVVGALKNGTLKCEKGVFVMRSETQKLYFLGYHNDKKADAVRIHKDVYDVKA